MPEGGRVEEAFALPDVRAGSGGPLPRPGLGACPRRPRKRGPAALAGGIRLRGGGFGHEAPRLARRGAG